MDAESEYEINRARDAVQMIQTIQSMIDVSADRLEGLRTQCSTSAELTQQEIRTLEGKLVKHFSHQLVIKQRFGDELQRELSDVPRLAQWLRVVGLCPESIEAICARVPSVEALRERPERELRSLLARARDEEVRRLCGAMLRLRTYTEALARGESSTEMQLYWDSWERHVHARGSPRGRPRHQRGSVPGEEALSSPLAIKGGARAPATPVSSRRKESGGGQASASLPAPVAPLTKSRSHESQLSVRPDNDDLSDNSQSSTAGTSAANHTPPSSPPRDALDTPAHKPHANTNNTTHASCNGPAARAQPSAVSGAGAGAGAPRSPRTPTVGRCMAHDIAHRFTKTFNMIATCDYCDKQMLFGSGLKCKECKFKCHRDCESKVPPSCGLPPEFVLVFRERFYKDGRSYGPLGSQSPVAGRASGGGGGGGGLLSSLTHRPRRRAHLPASTAQNALTGAGGPDSSSNTSSCNSSTPSSPALIPPATPHPPPSSTKLQQFHFPDVKSTPVSSPSAVPPPRVPLVSAPPAPPANDVTKEDLASSVKSDSSRCVSLSGSASTDSERAARGDSLDDPAAQGEARWPRQNSLSMKEWDIPYDELKLFEAIGTGRFGTVYRGSWHGAVAVKLLHVQHIGDEGGTLDSFKHEVATFRKTRHENLVLFMGACMKPPKLAIVTSLCKGMTLYSHIHQRRDKFNANKSALVAQQISQGMGYLHARGIVHKDLKTKNIFLENGKVVITDFGLFSVTKLCFGNNRRGDSLGIPAGWLCYLAPELVRALRPHASVQLPFSKASDVYAFGTVWYELLCGEWPFKGQPAEAVIWQVGRGIKQSLATLQASRDIKDILMLCWSYRASERPDFAHLLSTLEKLPRKRLARSPSHPVHLSRSAESVF